MEKRIQNLEDAVADIKRMMGEGDDVEEMSEETPEATTEEAGENPKTVTTKTTEVVEFSAEEELEKLKAENEKLKTELAEQPAAAPLDTNKFSADNKKTYTKQEFSKLSRRERILYGITNN